MITTATTAFFIAPIIVFPTTRTTTTTTTRKNRWIQLSGKMSQADQERLLLSEPALNAFIVAEMRHFLTSALEENEKPHNKKRKWKLSTKEKIDLQLITDPKTVAAAGEEEDYDDENNNVVHHHHQVIINEEYAKAKKSMTGADAIDLLCNKTSIIFHDGYTNE